MPSIRAKSRSQLRHRSRGQSVVEFALTVPLLLILTMVAVDFGRIYLGWINLQNVARIAANYAADHPTAWTGTGNASQQQQYHDQIDNDAKASNCGLPQSAGKSVVPTPVFAGGTSLGGTARVDIRCTFRVVTPIVGSIFGSGGISVGASAVFPVKSGIGAGGGGGGNPVVPVASFTANPTSGGAGVTVTFTDTSTGSPSSWTWDFGDATSATGQGPQTHQYNVQGNYLVTLTAANANGTNTSAPTTITVGPAQSVDFDGAPQLSGPAPLTVNFTDLSTGNPTAWAWTFGDGQTSTLQNPPHTYQNPGNYTVSLTVSFATGPPLTATKANYVTVSVALCTVPNFAGTSSSNAQATWNAANFTTTVKFKQGGLPWTIQSQDIVGNSIVACNSVITVSKN
jgi:PKD repeat protein